MWLRVRMGEANYIFLIVCCLWITNHLLSLPSLCLTLVPNDFVSVSGYVQNKHWCDCLSNLVEY